MTALRSCRLISHNLKTFSFVRQGNITSFESLSTSTIPPVYSAPPSLKNVLSEKFKKLMEWYEEVTGLKDVRLSQDKVLKAEDRFIAAQDARRDVSKQLAVVRDRLKDIYSELDQTSRGEDRYVLLITQEHKVLKEERRLADLFTRCEQEERENFSILSSAVKESHEKERIQAERTKYWSIIGSIIGTMIGVAGSSINNEFKMRELRKLVKESAQATLLSRQESDLPKDLLSITNSVRDVTQKLTHEQGSVLAAIEKHNLQIEERWKQIQKITENQIRISEDGTVINVDHLLEAQRKENRILAAICLSSVVCMLFVSKVFS